jgi:hypothetical protein
MRATNRIGSAALGIAASLALVTCLAANHGHWSVPAKAAPTAAPEGSRIVAMRRLTESQYRNSIADIFGPDIKVAGRFEPIVRPVHELLAAGARDASISPTGFEQFDAIARGIAAQVFDEKHRDQFASCAPRDESKPDPACARKILTPLGRYLFRRPLTASEQALYTKIASDSVDKAGSFHKGLELSLAAMLVSPNFLYVVETAEPDPAHPGQLRLDNYSRASRLSFMLWNTTPNENLLKAAQAGRLTDPRQLSAIASQMVDSPRFEQGVRAFFSDMLIFEKFDELSKDPIIYPYFDQQVAQAMPEQMLRTIVDELLTHDGDYRQLFTTSRTFMNRSLAALYQVPIRKSEGWEPYQFKPSDDRAGILGQAGFLALYSHEGRSSPTLRGRAIRELLMCQPVPNPPGNVNFKAVQDIHNKAMPTARDRLMKHATDPVCAGCHRLTDPVGLSLERFDGSGAFRATENGAPIDPSGAMDGVKFDGAMGLGKTMAANPATTQCVASRALEYATAGSPDDEAPLVDDLDKQFAASGYKIRDLFLRVATMPATWEVKAKPLEGGPTHVSMAGN